MTLQDDPPRPAAHPAAAEPPAGVPGWLWVVPAVLGAAMTALIMVVLPPDRTLDHVGELLFELSPLCLAVAAVALFPRGRWGPALVVGGVVAYMGLVDTAYVIRTFEYVDRAAAGDAGSFDAFYQFTLFVNAFTILFALFAFRLGGAPTATVARAGVAGVLVVVSGLNDLTYWAMADWPGGRPDTLDWASHIEVVIGHAPSVAEAVAFTAVHLALAAAALVVPVRRGRP